MASLASELGHHEEALRHWSECASVGDPVVAARAALRASDAAMALGLGHEAWRQWQRARAQCDRDAALAVETRAHEAELQWYLEHRPTESRAAAEAALAAGRGLAARSGGVDTLAAPVRRALLRALGAATDGALNVGDVGAMLAFADERATLAAGVDERTEIRALVDGALALRLQGRNLDAEARLRPLWDLVRRQVLPQATLEVGAMFGNVLLSSGRLEEAAAVSDECVALGARLVEFGPARALTVALPHLIELTRGEWRRAIEGLRESATAEPDPHYRLHAHKERAAALAHLDPHNAGEEVRDAVAAALADADQARCDRCLAETAARGAEALARIGDAAAARSLLGRTDVHPTDAYNRLCLRRAQAALAVITADEETAVGAVESVIAEAERQGLHLEALGRGSTSGRCWCAMTAAARLKLCALQEPSPSSWAPGPSSVSPSGCCDRSACGRGGGVLRSTGRTGCRRSPVESGRSPAWSAKVPRTLRSRPQCSCPARRSSATSQTSSPSSACATVPNWPRSPRISAPTRPPPDPIVLRARSRPRREMRELPDEHKRAEAYHRSQDIAKGSEP